MWDCERAIWADPWLPVLTWLPAEAFSLFSNVSFLEVSCTFSAGIRNGRLPLGEAWLQDAETPNSTPCNSRYVCHFRQAGLKDGMRCTSESSLLDWVKMKRTGFLRAAGEMVLVGSGFAGRVRMGKWENRRRIGLGVCNQERDDTTDDGRAFDVEEAEDEVGSAGMGE